MSRADLIKLPEFVEFWDIWEDLEVDYHWLAKQISYARWTIQDLTGQGNIEIVIYIPDLEYWRIEIQDRLQERINTVRDGLDKYIAHRLSAFLFEPIRYNTLAQMLRTIEIDEEQEKNSYYDSLTLINILEHVTGVRRHVVR